MESDDEDLLLELLDPYPDELTATDEISTKVNDPSNDSPPVIEPLDHEQSGIGAFG